MKNNQTDMILSVKSSLTVKKLFFFFRPKQSDTKQTLDFAARHSA